MNVQENNSEQWTSVLKPASGWFDLNLRELWRYRDLIQLFVRRDFVAFYKQTVLGPLWFMLQPLFTTMVFTIVFGIIAHIPTDDIPQPLFYMGGIVVWNYFADCLIKTSDTFVTNAGMFGKVYFPRLAVPCSIVLTNLITFAIQFALFLLLLAYYSVTSAHLRMSYWMLITPLLLIQMAALGLGLGILISSLTTKYRDLRYVVGFGVSLWLYATPIVYPLSQVPERWQWVYMLNPMAAIVETMRFAYLGAGGLRPWHMGASVIMTSFILLIGLVVFTRAEKNFMDTI